MSELGKRTGSRDLDAPCEDQHQTQPESCGSRLGAGMHSLRKFKKVEECKNYCKNASFLCSVNPSLSFLSFFDGFV